MIELRDLNYPLYDKKYIYHYTSADTTIKHILKNKKLKFSSLKNTNDPLEFLDYVFTLSSDTTTSEKDISVSLKKMTELNSIIKEKIKICCFCHDDKIDLGTCNYPAIFNKGFCRSRMWSQYADVHKGVCLIFNKLKLLNVLRQENSVFTVADDIAYDNELNDLDFISSFEFKKIKDLNSENILKKYVNTFLFSKLKDYEHEQEYRIALYSNANNICDNVFIGYEDALEGIILGTRLLNKYYKRFKENTKKLNISLFRLYWINGKPYIDRLC